ncbi:MAG: hypothetical protein ACI4XE_11830 [Acutalibacteraceae bacterium]
MKIKKILSLLAAVIILMTSVVVPFSSLASVVVVNGTVRHIPGNTQSTSPAYSLAWLDNIVIRDDAMAIAQARIVPKGEYPYSHTYEEFLSEVDNYRLLEGLNEQTVEDGYNAVVNALFYVVTACGMTINEDGMKNYLIKKGVNLPAGMSAMDKTKAAVVFAAMKYDAIYVLYNKKVTFPKGVSLDGAITIILAELLASDLPSDINTVLGFGMYNLKQYVTEFDQIPISDNPTNSEIFHWVKIITAAKNEYQVPLTQYDEATQAQLEYVDYAYYATIFDTAYDIHISPIALADAEINGGPNETARLILKTMLNEKGVSYESDATCEQLFELACKNGCFPLDEEFYSDIFEYDLYVDKNCEKLWFTPFALADQIDGENKYVKIYLADKTMSHSSTTYAALDPEKKKEVVTMLVEYDDNNGNQESVTYTFNVIKYDKTVEGSTAQNDIVANIQNQVSSVIPQGNETANQIVNNIFDAVDNQITPPTTQASESSLHFEEDDNTDNTLSTYSYTTSDKAATTSAKPDYLQQLLDETYATDSSVGSGAAATQEEAESSFAERAAATVKENPEVVAAPTSILAVGLLAGYMFNVRKKPSPYLSEDNDDENGED